MTEKSIPFVTVNVFTNQRLAGNQLAVVNPRKRILSNEEKQKIAREFNFSETVFLYDDDADQSPRVEIYTPVNEMDFAGHPVIGTGHVLFRHMLQASPEFDNNDAQTLMTKAGPVGIHFDHKSQTVSAEIPHNVHLHSKYLPVARLIDTQPSLCKGLGSGKLNEGYPVVSIVKGVTYVLTDFTDSPDLFASVAVGPSPFTELDAGWSPSFTGTMYYRRLGPARTEQDMIVQDLRVRMVAISLEDPACGSGSATLAAHLALHDGQKNGRYRFNLDQGSEVRRQSYITVDVILNGGGDGISKISLVGQAALTMAGQLYLPE